MAQGAGLVPGDCHPCAAERVRQKADLGYGRRHCSQQPADVPCEHASRFANPHSTALGCNSAAPVVLFCSMLCVQYKVDGMELLVDAAENKVSQMPPKQAAALALATPCGAHAGNCARASNLPAPGSVPCRPGALGVPGAPAAPQEPGAAAGAAAEGSQGGGAGSQVGPAAAPATG